MSSLNIAIIKCQKCLRKLGEIKSAIECKGDDFIPQDIMYHDFALPSIFCNFCLNNKETEGGENER